jgi:hypothetical protein
MVTANPRRNKKKDDEVDVQVITRGGEKMGMDLEHDEISSQRPEEKIIKVAQPPPNFDVVQQKQFSQCIKVYRRRKSARRVVALDTEVA